MQLQDNRASCHDWLSQYCFWIIMLCQVWQRDQTAWWLSIDVGGVRLTGRNQTLTVRSKHFPQRLHKELGRSRTVESLVSYIPDKLLKCFKKVGVFEGKVVTRIQCARSLGRFSVPASIQAQAMPSNHSWSCSIQGCHIHHIHFVPFMSIESCSDISPIVSSSLQLPFSFFHQLLALLLGVALAYASPT